MILTWLNHHLSGYLLMEMTGFSPERFFNVCGVRGIEIWNVSDTGSSFRFYLTVKGFRNIKPIVRKSKVRLKVLEKFGLPFFLYRNRKRKLYGAGLVTFFVVLYLLSSFIWDIKFDGNHMYTYDTLLKYCASREIHYGMKKSKVDCDGLEEALRSEFPEITWVFARVSGTRLLVKIKENEVMSSVPVSDETPRDLVAQTDGVITSMIVRSGVPMVSVGDEVKQGDVLVSGTLTTIGDNEEVMNTHYVRADADIKARTEYHFIRQLPLFCQIEVDTGKVRRGRYLKVFDYSMMVIRPKPDGTSWKTSMEEEQLHLFQNFYLPIYLGKITANEYITYERPYRQEEKEREAETINENLKKNLLEKGVQILGNHVKILDNESLCQITLDFTTEESLGISRDMEVPMIEKQKETDQVHERN